jgi:histidinol-phosphate/aromatic aminotransferase/cobyric acid decarboxylase-like protein
MNGLSRSGEFLFKLLETSAYSGAYLPLSGWDPPFGLPVLDLPSIELPKEVERYIYEDQLSNLFLVEAKDIVASWLTERSLRRIEPTNLLIAPGATSAITLLLHHYASEGYRLLVADTPLYFSYYRLASSLCLRLETTPRTLVSIDGVNPLLNLLSKFGGVPKIIVMSDPKYSMSTTYGEVELVEILKAMRSEDYLIIDRAMDLRYVQPFSLSDNRVIEIWSVGKPIGINACRLAILSGARQSIRDLVKTSGWIYGSLDASSISFALSLLAESGWYRRRTVAISDLVGKRFLEQSKLLSGDFFRWIKPMAGYLSLLLLDISEVGRLNLYRWAIQNHVHAMFSAHVGLLRTDQLEAVRINHLLDINGTLKKLSQFMILDSSYDLYG